MKHIILSLFLLFFFSCKDSEKEKNCREKYKNYNNSLIYLKEYLKKKDSVTSNLEQISKRIKILESTSKIESEIGGELLGKYRVSQKDIKEWENWIKIKCK